MKRKIIIPDCECMSDEQYKETMNILDSLPVNYEVWNTEEQ